MNPPDLKRETCVEPMTRDANLPGEPATMSSSADPFLAANTEFWQTIGEDRVNTG
jgi:hypothetical protein